MVDHPNGIVQEIKPNTPLSEAERAEREQYELRIEGGLAALYEIKVRWLWHDYASFAAYVEARWDMSARQANHQVAGYRVILTLTAHLEGTGIPLPKTEYSVRPLVTLADENPSVAVQVYQQAVELAGGSIPTHDQTMMARTMILSPEKIEEESILAQLEAMRHYDYLVEEIRQGLKPALALGLATALEACESYVRQQLQKANIRDLAFIRSINDDFRRGSETATDVLLSGYLQGEDWHVKLSEANAKDYRRLKDEKFRERIAQSRDEKLGEPVSILVFNGDPEGTLESLKKSLNYMTLIRLGALIGEL